MIHTTKTGFVASRPICVYLVGSVLNVQKCMTLTFDLLLILNQNLTFAKCMCSGGICVSQIHHLFLLCVLRLDLDFQRAEDRVY